MPDSVRREPHPRPAAATAALTLELADLIFSLAVRHVAGSSTPSLDPTAICRPLNALPRSVTPLATQSALHFLAHVDVDTAAKRGDLGLIKWMVKWSKQPRGRPVNYTAGEVVGYAAAASSGSIEVLDWLMDHLHVAVDWDHITLDACMRGRVHVLDWVKQRDGLPHVKWMPCVQRASRSGHAHVLDWMIENVDASGVVGGDTDLFPFHSEPYTDVMGAAAERGHVHVLDWWWAKARAGLALWPRLDSIVLGALMNGQVPVLEWCQLHPQVVQEHNARNLQDWSWMRKAMKHDSPVSLNWIDELGIAIDNAPEYAWTAVHYGRLDAVKWLHAKGLIVGDRLQLVSRAANAPAVSVELFEWIHAHFDERAQSASPDRWQLELDPMYHALERGHEVAVLDWLVQNGYAFQQQHHVNIHKYFQAASRHNSTRALDWLYSKVVELKLDFHFSGHHSPLPEMLGHATSNGHICILDWWLQRMTEIKASRPSGAPFHNNNILSCASARGHIDTIEWWLYKSGVLKKWFTINNCYVELCGQSRTCLFGPCIVDRDVHLAVLNTWLQAGYKVRDPVGCIHAASAAGNVYVLDWLLHVAGAPLDAFVQVYTRPKPTHSAFASPLRHSQTALWWIANVPVIRDWAIGRQPESQNPIVFHLLKHGLGLGPGQGVDVCDPIDLSKRGNTAMLQYLVRIDEQELLKGACEKAVVEASKHHHVHVLQWWKNESRVELTRPNELDRDDKWIGASVKKWWADSEL